MKRTQQLITIQLLLMMMVLLMPALVHAQPDGTPGDPDVPIDGGLAFLAAAGVGYGAKKLTRKGKQRKKVTVYFKEPADKIDPVNE